MAEIITKTVVELEKLGLYDELIKAYIAEKDAVKLQTVAFDEATNTINYYTIGQPVGESTPAFSVTLPTVDFTEVNNKIATVEEDVAKNAEDIAALQTSKANASDVYTKAEVDSAIEASEYDDTTVKADIEANASAIEAINNADTGILAQAKAYADGKDDAIAEAKKAGDDAQDAVDALAEKVGTVEEGKTIVGMIEDVVASAYDDTEVRGLIQDNADAIQAHKDSVDGVVTTLVGEDANKSVRTIANEELAKQLIAEGAKESLDTLQEIAAWIQNHPDDASAMSKAIEDLEALVGTLPEGVTATTIVGYVDEVVAAEKTRAEGVESGLDTRLTTVEGQVGEGSVDERIATAKTEAVNTASADATTKADKALEDAKAYADGLAGNYETAGTAEAKVKELADGQVATNTAAITSLQESVNAIQYATEDEIRAMFA